MKQTRIKIAAVILGVIAVLIGTSYLTVERECHAILDAVAEVAASEQADADEAVLETKIRQLQTQWKHTYLVLQLFIPITELEEADTLIARLPALKQSGCEELTADCAAITASIRRIRKGQLYIL